MLGSCEHGKELVHSIKVGKVFFKTSFADWREGGERTITFNDAVNY
jgi:hypothetical protein